MRRSRFRLFTACLFLLIAPVIASSAFAQATGSVGYRVYWPVMPPESTGIYVNDFETKSDANGNPNYALVVGWYLRSDRPGRQAFVYDHFGFIDPGQPRKFWDIDELVGSVPPSWAPVTHVESSFSDVNGAGRTCGNIKSAASDRIGVFFDLVGPNLELQQLPPTSANDVDYSGRSVNELGEVLITGNSTGTYEQNRVSIFDPPSVPI